MSCRRGKTPVYAEAAKGVRQAVKKRWCAWLWHCYRGRVRGGLNVIKLFDVASGAQIGTLTEAQLQFLIDQLEEESDDDRDYYINAATLDVFEEAGADHSMLDLLRKALGNRSEMDLRWER